VGGRVQARGSHKRTIGSGGKDKPAEGADSAPRPRARASSPAPRSRCLSHLLPLAPPPRSRPPALPQPAPLSLLVNHSPLPQGRLPPYSSCLPTVSAPLQQAAVRQETLPHLPRPPVPFSCAHRRQEDAEARLLGTPLTPTPGPLTASLPEIPRSLSFHRTALSRARQGVF